MLDSLEDWLAGVFKSAPKLNPNARKSIINIWPWVALIFGILQLLAALALWNLGHRANQLANTVNSYYGTSGFNGTHLNIFYWISLLTIIVSAVILLLAFPRLRQHAKMGWKLLFYGTLLNLVYGVFAIFNNYGNISTLLEQIVITALVLYFLFQIRDSYHAPKS